ncbi:hypothetical protein Tco_0424187 [Tanacetum coccineum]
MALLLAEDQFLKVKQALEEGQNQPENVQELLLKLLNDLQTLNKMKLKQEEHAAKILMKYYKNSPVVITPDFPITDSLIMEDEHLDTIPETESDEENKHSVEDLNLTPSEFEDLSDIEKIDEADFDPEEEIRLVEKLLYDNSSPRPPEELNSRNFDAVIESFSPSPIPVEGSDSLM